MAMAVGREYSWWMPGTRPRPASTENQEARRARFAREAEMIAHARAQIAAGRVVTQEAFDEWVDSLGSKSELPAAGRVTVLDP